MTRPSLAVDSVPLGVILNLRDEYRREMNCQIVHDSWHVRGFTDSYALYVNGEIVGYGSVGSPGQERDTIKEFFLKPRARASALPLFRELASRSGARIVEAQTNDLLLMLMLYDTSVDLTSETILFADTMTTRHAPPGAVFRPVTAADRARMFPHAIEPVGDWGLEADGAIAATGGLFFHYNPPYGDLYMEVSAPYRGRGFGTYLVQELKRVCREMDCRPSARCSADNPASRRALERAGMLPCARIVRGRLAV